MDPQAPITPENVPPITEPVVPETPKDNHWITTLSMAIFVLLSLGAVAFLYYQNQQLKSMLASYQTPIASPTPTATADPTANWKTISNKFWTFKVPTNLNFVKCSSVDQILVGLPTATTGLFKKDQTIECNFDQSGELLSIFRGIHNSENDIIIPTNTDPKLDPVVSEKQTINVGDGQAVLQKETTQFGQGTGTKYKVYIDNPKYTDVITFNDIAQKTLLDQILSTFRFDVPSACKSTNLSLSLNLPNQNWDCNVDNLGKELKGSDGTIALKSPIFTVQISSLGRGAFCDLSDSDPSSPRYDPTNACGISEFYSKGNVTLKTYKLSGQTKEIFGQIGNGPSISITYTGMDKRDLTSTEKAEILSLLDSIKTTN